jgi:hypothetical protein
MIPLKLKNDCCIKKSCNFVPIKRWVFFLNGSVFSPLNPIRITALPENTFPENPTPYFLLCLITNPCSVDANEKLRG